MRTVGVRCRALGITVVCVAQMLSSAHMLFVVVVLNFLCFIDGHFF